MSSFDIYVFILCLIVFLALTVLFACLVTCLVKQTIRLVRAGLEDERITKEYELAQKKKRRAAVIADYIVSAILCCALLAVFGFSLYVNFAGEPVSDTIPALSVVQTGSMASKHEKNTYLFENNLNDQVQTFDLVLLYKLPPAEELELYDIVLYEVNGTPLLHRIVGIEPPTEAHGEYYFLLQGDAVESPDRFPVYYDQMRGIYRGESVPFIGSFILFMQSVAGYLCILLAVLGMITIPVVEKKINKVKMERLAAINALPQMELTKNTEDSEVSL